MLLAIICSALVSTPVTVPAFVAKVLGGCIEADFTLEAASDLIQMGWSSRGDLGIVYYKEGTGDQGVPRKFLYQYPSKSNLEFDPRPRGVLEGPVGKIVLFSGGAFRLIQRPVDTLSSEVGESLMAWWSRRGLTTVRGFGDSSENYRPLHVYLGENLLWNLGPEEDVQAVSPDGDTLVVTGPQTSPNSDGNFAGLTLLTQALTPTPRRIPLHAQTFHPGRSTRSIVREPWSSENSLFAVRVPQYGAGPVFEIVSGRATQITDRFFKKVTLFKGWMRELGELVFDDVVQTETSVIAVGRTLGEDFGTARYTYADFGKRAIFVDTVSCVAIAYSKATKRYCVALYEEGKGARIIVVSNG